MRFSIRYQLMLPLLALILGLVGVSFWHAWSSGRRARQQIERQIDDIATTLSGVSFPLNTHTLNLIKKFSRAEFLICDEQRHPIWEAPNKPLATLSEVPATLPAAGEYATQHFDNAVTIGGQNYLCGGVPLRHGTRSGAILYVLYPESLLRDAEWEALRPALIFGIVGGSIALLLSAWLTQRLGSRIRELGRRTGMIAAGDFSPMNLPRRNDELRDLAKAVNDMAQQLAQFQITSRQTERLRLLGQVSGGIAHQLRNGVAGARLAIQLFVRDHNQLSVDAAPLKVALRQLSLLELHLKRFLDLGSAIQLHCRPCNLMAMVLETVEMLGPQCKHAHVEIRMPVSADTPLVIDGDPDQLGHLILNVISNAIDAAGPNGWIDVRWGIGPDNRAFVEVRDSGIGPPPEVAARVFDPFVTGKREGVGLGLAVARQVAEAHGGAITWQREPNCTCFRIELARETASHPV